MQIDDRRAKQLHFDVMGIALAIRGHVGETGLYQEIDAALTAEDWRTMILIQNAFEMLSEQRQALIMSDMAKPEDVGYAIGLFENTLRMLLPKPAAKMAQGIA